MPEQILDGRAIGQALTAPAGDLRTLLLSFYPGLTIPPDTHVVRTAEPLVARVNNGTWIASCSCGAVGLPRPGCVVYFDGDSALVGWCPRCGNQAWGGGWRPVIVPAPEARAQIEALLLCRPNVGDRNWEPHETVADLIAQNREHGDPVPDLDGLIPPPPPLPMTPFGPLPKRATGRLRRLADRLVRER